MKQYLIKCKFLGTVVLPPPANNYPRMAHKNAQGGGLRLLLLECGLQLHNTQRSLVAPLRTLAAATTACRNILSGSSGCWVGEYHLRGGR